MVNEQMLFDFMVRNDKRLWLDMRNFALLEETETNVY